MSEWSMLEDLSLLQLVIQYVSNTKFDNFPDIWKLIGDKLQLSSRDCQRRYIFLSTMLNDHKPDHKSSTDSLMKSNNDSYLSKNENSNNSLRQGWQEEFRNFELLNNIPHQDNQQLYDVMTTFEDKYHGLDSDMTPLDSIFCQPDIFSQ